MRPSVEEISGFYATALGRRAVREVRRKLTPLLAQRGTDRVLGLGYCGPFLDGLEDKPERLVLLMPARQGVMRWPRPLSGQPVPNRALLADETAMPFADALFDQVVVIHGLEFVDPARRLLREIWRVLAPNGRLLLVAANRSGLWAHFEKTPFGNGRPYGRGQLQSLLQDSLFQPLSWQTALVMPPVTWLMPLERTACAIAPNLGGVHIVLAEKTDGLAPAAPVPAALRQAKRQAAFPASG
ncbi:class I SAM-dependent methyltransferase [Pedomonas mirosovicensis]|uniref:class I SAM-dependent methyltransferase n=1 Tax=Pedomonas mirosovicensis TaxID=2908641 RepID=UPI00216AADEB|nr:class I SAM-dependent methyltransferase [Pedomonas mirosovicensis]MCH8684974.1 methyltransferase domain-containing protein [Pedomonas mirosovicensis]